MPYRAPATGPTVNLFAAELLGQAAETDQRRVTRLVLALHRGAELPQYIARSTLPALLQWAEAWEDAELVEGRDTTTEELQTAWLRLHPVQAELAPSAVPQPPSVSS